MKKTLLLSAPRVDLRSAADSKWVRERCAFLRLRPALLRSHRNRYVAIHQGKLVDSGEDEIASAMRIYGKFGYVPIYLGRVSDEPKPIVRVPSPRLKRTSL